VILTKEKRSTGRETCFTATLSTTNLTWTDLGSKPGVCCAEPANNRQSHGTYWKTDICMGADKSLARPGGKQATATEHFDVHVSYLLS